MALKSLGALLCLALAGCAVDARMADEITTFNTAQAQGANQILLLNILRSRDRQPLAYSHFDVLRGSGGIAPAVSLSFPWGPGARGGTASTGLALAGGVSDDVKPQDDQDFYRGILTSVTPETWALYQDQNWPLDLLFHLFVEDIQVSQADYAIVASESARFCIDHADVREVRSHCNAKRDIDAAIAALGSCDLPKRVMTGGVEGYKFGNDPEAECDLLQFEGFAQTLMILGFHIAGTDATAAVGPVLTPGDLKGSDWPLRLNDPNIKIVEVSANPPRYRFMQKSTSFSVHLANLQQATVNVAGQSGQSASAGLQIHITTRSPDGMIYYLGEVARTLMPTDPDGAPRTIYIHTSSHTVPLLAIEQASGLDAAVAVDYAGTRYSVPRLGHHATMEVFSLVQQVFALYNKASTTPTTAAVVVN